jgi:uncharacterized protein (TIGR02266 family)
LSKLENVSIGGAFVLTKENLPVGTDVKLKFHLTQDTDVIEAAGVVVWVYRQPDTQVPNSSGIGIRFTEILQEDRQRIADFVSEHTKHEV